MTKFVPHGIYVYVYGNTPEDIVIVLEVLAQNISIGRMVRCLIITDTGNISCTELDPQYRQRIA